MGRECDIEIAYSVNGVPIRLTHERWFHVTENHVENPEFIMRGNKGNLKATKNMGRDKWLVVIYRETSKQDGFIITAYFLDKKPKGDIIWRRMQ